MMRSYVRDEIDLTSSPDAPPRPSTREPGQPIQEVCASQKLEEVLDDPNVELKVSYKVPESEAAKYVSEKTTGMEMPPEAQFVGKTAGLGLKRKNAEIAKEMKAKKAKTLAEKRDQLEEDIMKYGLAAIERLYPRQPLNEVQPSLSPNKAKRPKGTPIKMKPKPMHLDFEEVDARKILKPFSHGKYIKEPEYDHMVYINRREGLVPLSSLCKEDAKSIMSSNVKLLKGRNVRLGKPRVFVKENGRLVAIGGSRDPAGKGIKVLRAPKLVKILPMERMLPFEIDPEYASFAVSAIPDIPKSKRVDIRVLKRLERQKRLENKSLTEVLSEDNSSIVKHLWDKLGNNPESEELEIAVEKAAPTKENFEEKNDEKASTVKEPKNDEKMEVEEKEAEDMVPVKDDIVTDVKDFELGAQDKVHNEWSNPKTKGKMPIDMTDDKPIVSEEFKKAMEAKKHSNALSGVDVCDVADCYCLMEQETAAASKCETPSASQSGSATPKDGGKVAKTKTAKNLKKVQRALKTLGVNFLHFEDEHQASDHEKSGQACDKDHCKLGCICDSISGKNSLPPSHCGKVECMFHCVCSKDALKLTNNDSNKIGISAEGLRSSAYRRLAQEELKFSNTVVASGVDLLMIGGSSGRQKRERKVPSRYQDTDAFFDSATGMPATSSQKAAAVLMLEEATQILPASGLPANSSTRRLTQDSLKHEKIKKCAVIMPRLDLDPNIKLWCLFHNQHDCPCFQLKNPLDHGPDLNVSRNVAKRTLGSNFKTKKRLESLSKPREYFGTLDLTEPPTIEDLRSNESLNEVEVIEEDPVPPAMDPKFYHDPDVHSSRTFGHKIKNLSKPTKYPHKIVVVKQDKSKKPLPPLKNIENLEQNQEMPKITSVTSLKPVSQFRTIAPKPIAPKPPRPSIETVLPAVTNSSGVRKQTVVINPKPTTEQVDDWRELRLGVKAKGSFIFIYWRVLRSLITSGRIKILAYTKTKQLALLVMWSENATVTQDMIDIHKHATFNDNTHPMFQKMKKLPELMDQDNTHVALIFNGLYWEVAGMAMQQLKEGAINADVQVIPKPNTKRNRHENNDQNAPPKVVYPSDSSLVKEAAPMNRLNPTSEIQVDPSTKVQKLPLGVNLVNMNRPGMPTPIQVKLPLTEFNQFWCTINVDGPELSVQVDLALTLKVAILKQAASLAAREKTTVRIPIKVQGEVDSFGVYAVPGLESHVFVGPFTAKEPVTSSTMADDDDDIICLDEPEETKPDPLALQDPSPKQPAKQPVVIDNAKIRQEAILGQVPQKVIKAEEGDADIISHDDDYQMVADRDLHPEKVDPLYLNPSKNPYGRVVINNDKERKEFYEGEENTNIIKLKIKDTETKVFMGKGNVTFMHPTLDDHEVFCENLNKAKLWLECHIGTSDKSEQLQQLIDDNMAKKGLSIKPMSDLIEPEHEVTKSPPPPLPDNTPIARIVNGRRFVCHQVQHNGRQGVAIVFDRRQHSDMRKLYHKLNQVLSSNGLKKITSSLQILNRARDEILRLEKLDADYTMKGKALRASRENLFKEFTSKLGHLTSKEEKKAAVLKLKEGLKTKQNKIISNPKSAGNVDESILIKPDIDSKLNPTENEINNTRDELMKLMPPKPIGHMRINNTSMHMSNSMASSSSSGITPYSDITGLQTVKKDGKVLRPMNAFMLWAKQKRKDLIAQGIDGAMVSKMLAGQWKKLDSAEQQTYFNEAERLKNLHQLQHPNYKFNPKARRMGMKKSVARLEPLTRVSPPAAATSSPPEDAQDFTVNIPDSASEDVVRYNSDDLAIHNLSSDQNIVIQPVDSIPSQPVQSQPLPQIIPIPEADQTFTTSVVELE